MCLSNDFRGWLTSDREYTGDYPDDYLSYKGWNVNGFYDPLEKKHWEITADAPKSPGKLGLCHVVSFLVEL
jgi:hypothetical protein